MLLFQKHYDDTVDSCLWTPQTQTTYSIISVDMLSDKEQSPRTHHPLAATTAARSVIVVHTHHSQRSRSAATLIVVVLRAKPDL